MADTSANAAQDAGGLPSRRALNTGSNVQPSCCQRCQSSKRHDVIGTETSRWRARRHDEFAKEDRFWMESGATGVSFQVMESWQSPHGRLLPAIGGRTLIMAVLNATPDSFSDGGQLATPQAVVDRAGQLIDDGADILDIGGESTRPGAAAVPVEEELARVLPVADALRRAFPGMPLSIDTYKANVADAVIEAGADIINDVWGLMHGLSVEERARWKHVSPEQLAPTPMAQVAARRRCPVIAMHNRLDRNYGDFWTDLLEDMRASIAIAQAAGVPKGQLWLDPGFGFAKNVPQNLEVLRDLQRLVALGCPVLVGTSRKSTLGAVLGTTVDDRLEGGGATAVWAIQQGCAMIRVHDVREMARFARMADAIKAGLDFAPA